MTGQETMTGRSFGGRYEIKDRIGIGGMAEVPRPGQHAGPRRSP
ncbi:MAG: hypothetical protein ACLTSX_13155 [Collinsella sp.]